MYVIQVRSGYVGVEQFNLTTAWDTSTLSYDTSLSIKWNDVQIRALLLKQMVLVCILDSVIWKSNPI